MKLDTESLAHTKWNCKYHIVFAPKYRRQVIYGKIKSDIGQILRKLCEYKGVEIIEAEACPGYYVDTVGRNKKAIQEYIKNQLQEDIASDQISLQEYIDPFTGEQVKKGK